MVKRNNTAEQAEIDDKELENEEAAAASERQPSTGVTKYDEKGTGCVSFGISETAKGETFSEEFIRELLASKTPDGRYETTMFGATVLSDRFKADQVGGGQITREVVFSYKDSFHRFTIVPEQGVKFSDVNWNLPAGEVTCERVSPVDRTVTRYEPLVP